MSASKARILTYILQNHFNLQPSASCFGLADSFETLTFSQAYLAVTSVTPPGPPSSSAAWEVSCRAALVAIGQMPTFNGKPNYSYESTYRNIVSCDPGPLPSPTAIRSIWSSAEGLPTLSECQAFEATTQTLLDTQENAGSVTKEILAGALVPGATSDLSMLLFIIRALIKAIQGSVANKPLTDPVYDALKQVNTFLNNHNVSDV